MNSLFEAWLSGRTVRKHTMDVHRHENVAEHTWGVLMLAHKYVPYASVGFFRYLTLHDMGEKASADIPAHICWRLPELKAVVQEIEDKHVAKVMQGPYDPKLYTVPLSPDEEAVAEILDRAEFVLSCVYELHMGNVLVRESMERGLTKIVETIPKVSVGELRQSMEHLSKDLMRARNGTTTL